MQRNSPCVSGAQKFYFALFLSFMFSLLAVITASAATQPATTSSEVAGVTQNAGLLSRIWLDAPRTMRMRYAGKGDAVAALSSGNAKGLSLAQGDFDEDGVADLVVGYATATGGAIGIHRGNLDARAPQSHKSFLAVGQGRFADPFLPQVLAIDVAVQPDFVAVADIDGDGHKDIVIGSRSSATIFALLGDGKGNFPRTLQLSLTGTVTALAAQRIDRGSPNEVLLAGVNGFKGTPPSLMAFTATQAGIVPLFTLPMRAPVSAFAFGNLDHDSYVDTALIAGGQLFILHGSDVHAAAAQTGTPKLEALSLGMSAVSVDIGTFIHDRDPRQQLAVMSSDGSVSIVAHSGLDAKPWSATELKEMHRASLGGARRTLSAEQLSEGWTVAENFAGVGTGSSLMLRTRLSGSGPDDIVVADSQAGQLHQISHATVRNPQELVSGLPASTHLSMPLGSGLSVMLAMHVNVDARPGLVMIKAGQVTPSVLMPLPDPTYFVNRTDDPVPTSPIANACNNTSFTDTSSSCSLREAVIKANGDTIMLNAATYTLTRPPVVDDFSGQNGALDILNGVTIIGEVDGSGKPISIIQAGTNASNGIDKVFGINPNFDTSFDTHLVNLMIQFGLNTQSFFDPAGAGGAIEWEATDTGTLNITNCVIQNNSTTDADGGGIAADNESAGSGGLTISLSTVQNNSANESSTGGSGIGGGMLVGGSTPVQVVNSKILNNRVTQRVGSGGQGGGVYIFDPGSASVAFHGVTISGNQSASHGGGIYAGGGITIDQSSVISNNTAGGDGGGLWFNALSETATITNATFTGNVATGNGGAIKVDSSASNTLNMSYSRLVGNTATVGSNLYSAAGTVMVTNNWWGTNAVASTIFTAGGATTYDPYVALMATASPNKIRINQSATLTADLGHDNHGASLPGSLAALQGLPVTFNGATLGAIPQVQPEALDANEQATATYNAGGVGGNGSAEVTVDQAAITAAVTVLQPPSITKSFNPVIVVPNAISTVTFTVANGNTVTIDSSFTDTLPANLVVASTPNVVNLCGGTVTAAAGSGSISFANASLATTPCTIAVNVQSATDGVYNNSVTINSADAGAGNTASATLTVINPPAIVKTFGGSTMPLNGTTTLTFTLNDTNVNQTLSGVAFTDSLPAGMLIATPNNLNSTCVGTTTAVAGASSASLSGSSLAPSASCTVSMNVTGTTVGAKTNIVQVSSTNGGTGNTSSANIMVVASASISKAFGAASIPLNGSTTLSFTIQNNNTAQSLSGIAFTDTFPAGLVVSAPNGLTGSCGGGTITSMQGTNVASLSGAALAQSSSCTFTVNVTGTSAGQKNNTTGAVSSTEGGAGGTASASLAVEAPLSIAAAFSPTTIPVNGTSTLTFTLTNPAANNSAETGAAFTNSFPSGIWVATPSGLVNTCGGTATAVAGGNSVSLTGGSVAANSSCTVTVNAMGYSGQYADTTSAVSSTNGGTGSTASATLTIASAPTVVIAFGAGNIPVGGSTSLTFAITNPNSGLAVTGVSVNDSLPAGLTISSPSGLVSTCTGSVTAPAGATTLGFSGATLAASGSCTFSVNVTAAASGVMSDTTGPISSNESGAGSVSNTATLTVLGPPSLSAAFGAPSIQLTGSTTLTFTIANPNGTLTLNGLAFNTTLPAGLVVSTPNGLTDTCGGTASAGGNAIGLTGGSAGANATCVVSVNVTSTAAGTLTDTTSAITSTNGGNGSPASASLMVLAPDFTVTVTNAGSFRQGDASDSYTITVSNIGNSVSNGTVSFVDTLPTGLTPKTIAGSGWSCTLATLTCTRADALAESASYPAVTLTVSVANNAAAQVINSATVSGGGEVVTSNDTGSDPTTVIQAADLTVSSSHTGAWVQEQTGDTYTLTVNNIGAGPTVGSVTVVDSLPAALTASGITGSGWSCTLGTLTCTRSDVLASGASYPAITLTVTVSANATSPLINSVAVSGGGELNTANDSGTDSTAIAAPTITITDNSPVLTIKAGQTGMVQLTVSSNVNLAGTLALTCQTSAPHVVCSLTPNPVAVTTGGTAVQLQLQTAGSNTGTANAAPALHRAMVPALVMMFGLSAMVLVVPQRRKRMAKRALLLMIGVMLLMIGMVGCGSPAATPAGTFTVTVSGSLTTPSGTVSAVAPVTFIVTSH